MMIHITLNLCFIGKNNLLDNISSYVSNSNDFYEELERLLPEEAFSSDSGTIEMDISSS